MTHHEAFLADIIADPDDDGPRLIYADWLEEHGHDLAERFRVILTDPADDAPRIGYACLLERQGDRERAEFIRVQVELAGTECECGHDSQFGLCRRCCVVRRRESVLFTQNVLAGGIGWRVLPYPAREPRFGKDPWPSLVHLLGNVNGSNGVIIVTTFRRGFVEDVGTDAKSWLEHADSLCAAAPIRRVRLTTRPVPDDLRPVLGDKAVDKALWEAGLLSYPYGPSLFGSQLMAEHWLGITFEYPPPADPRQTVQLQTIWY